MANLTIKNVPATLYHTLKERAHSHHRSINSEVIVCLELSLQAPRVDVDDVMKRARAIRNSLSGISINEALISKAKNEGRK